MNDDDKTRIAQDTGRTGPGTQLSGIYELDERIASGGMGEVWRGHNIQTGDHVAIKIVLPEFARDQTILSLFRKEASILNHLSNDAVVRYHVFTIDPGIARPYLAMEFVNGPSLYDIMRRGPMPIEEARRLCHRLTSGLAAVHEAGAVHRDLSPDNVILPDGRVDRAKIIDFGIARSANVGGETLIGGKFAGKYNYVSPEQVGLFGGEVSEQSDIYSLGLVLAAAMRGKPIDMSGSQVDVVEKRRVVPDLSDIGEEMRPILEAMLQPDPQDRPPHMAEIARMTREQAPPDYDDTMVNRPAAWRDRTGMAGSTPPRGSVPPGRERPPSFVPHQPPAHLSQPRAATARQPAPAPAPAHQSRPPRGGFGPVAVAAVAALAALGAGGAYFAGLFGPSTPPPGLESVALSTPAPDNKPPEQAPAETAKTEPLAEPKAPPIAEGPKPETQPAQTAAEAAKTTPSAPAEPPIEVAKVEPAPSPQPASPKPAPAEADDQPARNVPLAAAAEPPPGKSPQPAPPAQEPLSTPAPQAEPVAPPARPAGEPVEATEAARPAPAPAPATASRPAPAQPETGQDAARNAVTPAMPLEPRKETTAAPVVKQEEAEKTAPPPRAKENAKEAVAAAPAQPAATTPAAPSPEPVEPPAVQAPPAAGGVAEAPPGTSAKTPDNDAIVALNVPKPEVPAVPPADGSAERISWLNGYSGGDCFYAGAVAATETATQIEGFGEKVEPFNALEAAFEERFHAEPDISVRLIEPSQCEITAFLRAMSVSTVEKPQLLLDRTKVPDGAPISGTLETAGGLISNVLLIDHKGMAFNLDDRITVQDGRGSFSIPIGLGASDKAAGKPVPLVMIVITGPEAIHAADFSTPKPVATALADILAEIKGKERRFSTTAKYFSLGG